MGKVNRREFFEDLIATQVKNDPQTNGQDPVYDKYANKELPRGVHKSTGTLTQYAGQWTDNEIIHLLRRTTFGVRHEDVLALRNKTMGQAVDMILTMPANPTPPLNNYEKVIADPNNVPYEQTWVNAPYNNTVNSQRRLSMLSWWVGRMIDQQGPTIAEKMIFFWHNHFATEYPVVAYAQMMYNHHMIFRNNALGNFKTLVSLITKDPAMLRYLNGYLNTKTAPDENYARELFELFTLGKNYKPIYSEDDIRASAKILTGWRYNISTWSSYFNSSLHDTSDKQFSSFFGNKIITGKSGASGATETDELIDMIFTKQEAAKFIVRKLYRYFVYYDIDNTTEFNIIIPLAQLMVNRNWEVKPVLETLFKSEHFYDMISQDCYIRTPVDFIIGNWRSFDIEMPVNFDTEKEYKIFNYLRSYLGILGCEPGLPPNVAGWPAFYQEPDYYEKWINSSTLPKRMAFMDMMLNSGFSAGTGSAVKIDLMHVCKKFYYPGDPNLLVDFFVDMLLGVGLSKQKKDDLKVATLLSGQTQDYYWTNAWTAYVSNPNTVNTNTVKTRLISLLTELTHLAEHHLC